MFNPISTVYIVLSQMCLPKSRISQLLGQNNDLKITQQYKISTYTEL